jgi:hypothetical protein
MGKGRREELWIGAVRERGRVMAGCCEAASFVLWGSMRYGHLEDA